MVVKVRLQADSEPEAQKALEVVEKALKGACRLYKPREGTNPKYEGNQKWAVYGELDLDRVSGKKGPYKRRKPQSSNGR